MTYQSDVLAHSPVVYPRLGEASGAVAQDASPNNFDGTYNGSPTLGVAGLLTGNADTAVTFDGVDDYVGLGNRPEYDVSNLTLVIWLKTAAAGVDYRALIARNLNFGIFLYNNAPRVYDYSVSNFVDRGSALNDDVRHMVAFVIQDGVTNGSAIYVDGVLQGTAFTYGIGTAGGTTELLVGYGGSAGQFFTGTLDEPVLIPSALSAAQVDALWDSGLGGGGPTEPNAPTALTATTVSSSQITVSWTAPVDNGVQVDSYRVEVSLNGTTGWAEVTTVPFSTLSVNHSALAQDTQYWYRVRAQNAASGEVSPWSNIDDATTDAAPAVTFTSILATNILTDRFTVTWTTNVNASGVVQYASAAEWTASPGVYPHTTAVVASPTISHSITVTGLLPSTLYHYRVGGAAA